MIKILDSKIKNFDATLDKLLSKRKSKVQLNSVSVTKIIRDVKKNGDKAILRYEKRFNKNNTIIPNPKQIVKAIKSLDLKVKKAIDLAYNRIYKFHSLQKFKNISYKDKLQNKLEYKSELPFEMSYLNIKQSKEYLNEIAFALKHNQPARTLISGPPGDHFKV